MICGRWCRRQDRRRRQSGQRDTAPISLAGSSTGGPSIAARPIMGHMPTHHRKDIDLPNCFLIAAGETGPAIDALAHAFLEQHWRDDANLSDAATLVGIANGLNLDGAALLAKAGSAEIKAQYERNTGEAIERSVFGSPTYFADGDMFYGQDRLELVERALKQPYKR